MMTVFLSLVVIFLILVLSEVLWNTKTLKGELARKFVHITVGAFVAFWPFYMSFHTIQLVSLAFLVVVVGSRYLKIFEAVHTVERKSWGDLLFAIGIGLAATFAKSDWVFTAAILNLSLADGLAAIIGKQYGKTNNYKVLGYTKSIAGTATFWLISFLILILVNRVGQVEVSLVGLIALPTATAALENIGIYGLDNVFVPVLISLLLGRL